MSRQETIIGKIVKVIPQDNEDLEDQAKRILNCEFDSRWYDTFLCQLLDSNNYIIVNNNIYKIISEHDMEDEDYCIINKIDENTYSFITSFYNGVTCLTEMVEEELRKYENL